MPETLASVLDRHPDRHLLPFGIQRTLRALNLDETHAIHALELARIPEVDEPLRRDVILLALSLLAAQAQGHTRMPLEPGPGGPAEELLKAFDRADLDLQRLAGDDRLATLIGRAGEAAPPKPLLIDGAWLCSGRLHGSEARFAARVREVRARTVDAPGEVPEGIFTDPVPLDPAQREAVTRTLSRPLAIITGGPGTGKTSIVVAILRALLHQGVHLESVALAAPTGKAAQRMGEAIQLALNKVRVRDEVVEALLKHFPESRTLHRLLGWHPASETFRHGAGSPLAAQVVIVDEASMIGQEMMERLFQALAPGARIILLGDARQLPSVEPGSAFRDLVATQGDCTSWLRENHRMANGDEAGANILDVANALLEEGRTAEPEGVRVLDSLDAWKGWGVERWEPGDQGLRLFLDRWFQEVVLALDSFQTLANREYSHGPAGWGRGDTEALHALLEHHKKARILCALREAANLRGMEGINQALHTWMHQVTGAGLRKDVPFHAGEPVMMTANDYRRGIYNGDQGIVVRVRFGDEPRQGVVFEAGKDHKVFPVDALRTQIELSYAMTVHKAQGSEYDRIAMVLPAGDHPALTRDLLYTGITRARRQVILLGDARSVEWAMENRSERRSGARVD
ncbi:exodeoxyribonuclease V subunit alpha [Mesoterricola silvestris]|uniref:UvrD-like helicase C-terminal domain-containing protein n=1 Tax=Mesoterricola silvestris TaxID=2927979 RepID=A0AA48K8Q5_9BACT|nr:exodeoxyribonuclease V subunit alpha [Mesoterricola silvestris]BDU73174.1 hypothetical protein METEAL_23480 [Mesoterricola silvestris]